MLNRILGRGQPNAMPTEEQERTLREIAHRLPNLRWAALVSIDGLLQTLYDPFGKQNVDRISAMTAATLSLGERITKELQHGRLTYAIMAGDEGLFAGHLVGTEYTVAVGLPVETEIGTMLEALAQAAAALEAASFTDLT